MTREVLKAELDYLNKDNDSLQEMITSNILEVYDTLYKQGHSGGSFGYVTNLIDKLIFKDCLIKPIQAFEDDPDDWNLAFDGVYQNNRRGSVFYYSNKDRYYDSDKCVKTDNDGRTWFSSGGWFKTFEQIQVPYKPDGKKWHIYIEPIVELEPGYGASDGDYIIKKVEYL